MSIGDSPYSIDQDWNDAAGNAAATSGRVGLAPLATQGGRAALFKGPTNLFSLANVDALGSLQTSPTNPAGGVLSVYSGQATPSTTAQYGSLCLGRQNAPTPASYQPLLLDGQGALVTAGGGKPTFRVMRSGMTAASNLVLFSLMNNGSTYLRIAAVNIYVQNPGAVGAGGGTLLGLTSNTTATYYYPVYCEMHRITSHTKGSSAVALSPTVCDTADVGDTGVTYYSASTVSASAGLLHRRDALQCSLTGVEFYRVICGTERNVLCRPGEGIAVVCVSDGQVAAPVSGGKQSATIDVSVTLTQGSA